MSDDINDTKNGKSGSWKDAGSEKQNLTSMPPDQKDKKDGGSITWENVGRFTVKTAAVSTVVLGGTALALPAIGFTAGGVAAGSLAAGFQSAYLGGTIASGSAFALMQSVGAAGLAASTQAAVVAGSAGVVGTHSAVKKFMINEETDSQHSTEEPKASKNTFSLLQSAGAAGLSASSQAVGIITNAVVAGAHSAVKKIRENDETPQLTSEESNTSKATLAFLQNACAAGLAASSQAAVTAGSAVVAGAHSAVKILKKNEEANSGRTSEESSASGSAFALLKSAGAATWSVSSQAAVTASGAVVAGAYSAMKKLKK